MTTENRFSLELMVAKDIALKTWNKIAHFYDTGVDFTGKEDGTPVTEADKAANKFIVESLRERFPNDTIVSEEQTAIVNGSRTWYIDPIDGTKGFYKRNGHFAIHIGFCESSRANLGVVYWPAVGDLYSGIVGMGAWRENTRGILELKTNRINPEKLIAMASDKKIPRGFEKLYSDLRVDDLHDSGSEGLRLMKIAENLADFKITANPSAVSTWDVCAPEAVIRAAGGVVQYLDGTPIEYLGQGKLGKGYVASNQQELANKLTEFYRNKNAR